MDRYKGKQQNNQFASMIMKSMLSLIMVVCIMNFNVKKIYTFTAEDSMYVFEVIDKEKYKNHIYNQENEKEPLHFENNLGVMFIIPKQFLDINKLEESNINIYELPRDVSMKPRKYRNKRFNYSLGSIY